MGLKNITKKATKYMFIAALGLSSFFGSSASAREEKPKNTLADRAYFDELHKKYEEELNRFLREEYAKCRWDIDVSGGVIGLRVKQPSNLPTHVTFHGYGSGFTQIVEADLNIPNKVNEGLKYGELGIFYDLTGDGAARVGIFPFTYKFDFMRIPTAHGSVGSGVVDYADYGLPWGEWPIGGISMDLKQRNLLCFETRLTQKSNPFDSAWYFEGRLDRYSIDWNLWTSAYPYGDEWYGSLGALIISSEKLASRDETILGLGLKYIHEGDTLWFKFGTGIPLSGGDINTGWTISGGVKYELQ